MNTWTRFSPLSSSHLALSASGDESSHSQALATLVTLAECGASEDLLHDLWRQLATQLVTVDQPVEVLSHLGRFVQVSRSPTSLLALFQRDDQALPSLLQVLSTSPRIASLLVRDPESFDFVRASDGQPANREVLIDELTVELSQIKSSRRAAITIRRFAGREILRIAYGEFVRGLAPAQVGQQISQVIDAVLASALDWVVAHVSAKYALPQRLDDSQPSYAILALGNYGGEEIGYDAPLEVLLLCDQIDRKNQVHVDFNQRILSEMTRLCGGGEGSVDTLQLRFVPQPDESPQVADKSSERTIDFHTPNEASTKYERDNRTWQRLAFVKARHAAGDVELTRHFLQQIEPWVYHRILSRGEMADIRILRRKIEKRATESRSDSRTPIADRPGADTMWN